MGGGRPVPAEPCCRDGFVRLCLVRPFEWARPEPPTRRESEREEYRLCARCVQRRLSLGAEHDADEGFNPDLAN